MRTLIIMNPTAGSAAQSGSLHAIVASRRDIALCETSVAGEARRLSELALNGGYGMVLVAGGDGTINEVVQGLAADLEQVKLGIIPLGTGNDLARTLGIPLNPIEALELCMRGGEERRIDLIQVESQNGTAYCVNMAAGGFSGQVDEVLTEEMKARWGPLSYLQAAAKVLPDLTGYTTTLAYDGGESEQIQALNVIVANGKTCAGGLRVAPTADPGDGLMDVIVVRYASILDLAGVAARLVTGNYLDSREVFHRRARRVCVHANPGMWFNVDGELLTKEPATFTVVPRALRVVVGPGYGGA